MKTSTRANVNIIALALTIAAALAVCTARPEGAQGPRASARLLAPAAPRVYDAVADSAPAAATHVDAEQHPDDALLIGDSPAATASVASAPAASDSVLSAENTAEFWRNAAQATLRQHLQQQPNTKRAKNVIFFLGDGMSLPTVVAARMYLGQLLGGTGEDARLSFEDFPYVGLSKTYCVNKQTADSACSATAYMCGIKANYETIGVTGAVQLNNCTESLPPQNRVPSIVAWAQAAGKRTGIVTTTRITHASPAGAYAHTASRQWESDADMPPENVGKCADIAAQLVRDPTGRRLNVILGGGRRNFLPANVTDADGVQGVRADGVDLVAEWQASRTAGSQFVRNREQLLRLLDAESNSADDSVLGLFNADHLDYNLDADHASEPSLAEMTVAAVRRLQSPEGYFLFVEGGRIDHAHHENKARKALDETVQFSEAIRMAGELTAAQADETLIVVTSDHAHTMSISGYSKRGEDILGLNSELAADMQHYTTLSYGTGPRLAVESNGSRSILDDDNFADKDYVYPALVPLKSAAHGGDDVGVFARGPWAHLFTGVYEQNAIPHMIAYAACLGEGLTVCSMEGR